MLRKKELKTSNAVPVTKSVQTSKMRLKSEGHNRMRERLKTKTGMNTDAAQKKLKNIEFVAYKKDVKMPQIRLLKKVEKHCVRGFEKSGNNSKDTKK